MGLKRVLGRALVIHDELFTLVTELEAVVNDRPLTYASGNLPEPADISVTVTLWTTDETVAFLSRKESM